MTSTTLYCYLIVLPSELEQIVALFSLSRNFILLKATELSIRYFEGVEFELAILRLIDWHPNGNGYHGLIRNVVELESVQSKYYLLRQIDLKQWLEPTYHKYPCPLQLMYSVNQGYL